MIKYHINFAPMAFTYWKLLWVFWKVLSLTKKGMSYHHEKENKFVCLSKDHLFKQVPVLVYCLSCRVDDYLVHYHSNFIAIYFIWEIFELIDFKGISTCLGLFYAERLRNRIHCMFIFLSMVLDTTLLNTQHYKVRIKGKVEQSWEWSSALPYTLV